jgi:hypothetical protein
MAFVMFEERERERGKENRSVVLCFFFIFQSKKKKKKKKEMILLMSSVFCASFGRFAQFWALYY